jgi:hypothetical protein
MARVGQQRYRKKRKKKEKEKIKKKRNLLHLVGFLHRCSTDARSH